VRTILNTVGTSLARNASPSGSPDVAELIRFLALTDLRKASAETNALYHLLREDDALVFLHSETPESHLCARALAEFFENRGHETRMVCVRDLSYREADFRLGLRALVGTLVACIREERFKGREVLINATGGFKAEGAYATLVGLLFNVPVYYIYEAFQRIVQMPPLPIDWDYSVIAEHEDLLHSLSGEGRSKFELVRSTLPKEISSLLEERENRIFLSPAGVAVFEAYLEKVQRAPKIPVYFGKRALEWYQKADATTRERIRGILRRLCLPEVRRSGAKKLKNSRCFVYPQGHQNERVLFCEKGEGLIVCALAQHSDRSYDRLFDEGLSCEKRGKLVPFEEDF